MNKSNVEISWWGDALRYLMYFTPSWDCYVNSGTPELVGWQLKQIPHSFLDGCFWWLPQGSIERARTVIFRPIKSGVQVCGIIQWPWYFHCNNSLLPTLKIAGCWKSHYNHPSLQWKSLTEGGKITVVYKWGSSILPICLRKQFHDLNCLSNDKYRFLKET